jgi:hypothetical protein
MTRSFDNEEEVRDDLGTTSIVAKNRVVQKSFDENLMILQSDEQNNLHDKR